MRKRKRKSSRKRANGEGSIFQLDDGRWKAVLQVGTKVDGQRIRKSRIRKSYADASAALDKLRADVMAGFATSTRTSLSTYLTQWLSEFVSKQREPSTHSTYRSHCNTHIIPHLGSFELGKLSSSNIQTWLAKLSEAKVGKAALNGAFHVLNTALKHAYNFRLIPFNPCAAVESPKVSRKKIMPFEKDEAKKILDETRGDRCHGVHCCSLLCGMRQGEIFGLWWEHVDFENAKLHIVQQVLESRGRLIIKPPKTKSSIRILDIPPRLIDALRERKKIALREGNASSKFVFPNPNGGPMGRTYFRRAVWVPLLDQLGIKPHRGPHHCRHTFASLTLAEGVDVLVVSKVLGHKNASTTINTYAHALKSRASDASIAIQKMLG